MNVPRYIDTSESEEEIEIQATIDELKKLEEGRQDTQKEFNAILLELGFKV